REQMSTFARIPSCLPCRPHRTALDRLREPEHTIRIVLGLGLGQPGEVGTVVGLPPVGQRRVDVVLVGLAAGEGAHRLPEGLLPAVLAGDRGGRRAHGPGGGVLGLEERIAVHERGGTRGDPVDRAGEDGCEPAVAYSFSSWAAAAPRLPRKVPPTWMEGTEPPGAAARCTLDQSASGACGAQDCQAEITRAACDHGQDRKNKTICPTGWVR